MHTVSLQFCMLDAIKCIGLVDLVDDYDMDSGVAILSSVTCCENGSLLEIGSMRLGGD